MQMGRTDIELDIRRKRRNAATLLRQADAQEDFNNKFKALQNRHTANSLIR